MTSPFKETVLSFTLYTKKTKCQHFFGNVSNFVYNIVACVRTVL